VKGADIIPERIIESHYKVICEEVARDLEHVDKKTKDFMEKVIKANSDLVRGCKNA